MAKKATKPHMKVVVEETEGDEDAAHLEHSAPDPTDELDAVLAELGANAEDASITVTRIGAKGEERVGRFQVPQFDVDLLREQWGPGAYMIYAFAGGKMRAKHKVEFARTAEELRAEQRGNLRTQAVAAGILPAPAAPSSGDALAGFAGMFHELMERSAQQQREFMTLMLEAIRSRPAPDPILMQQTILDSASKIAELSSGGRKGGEVDALLRGVELARKMPASGGGGVGLGEILVEALRALPALEPMLHPQPQPARPQEQQQVTQVNGVQTPQRPAGSPILAALARFTPVLITASVRHGDPVTYANLIADQVPEQYEESFVGFLRRDDWWLQLHTYSPQLEPHYQFVLKVRNELLEIFSDEAEAEVEPLHPGVDPHRGESTGQSAGA